MITMDNGSKIKRFEDFNIICEMGYVNPTTPVLSNKTTKIPGKVGLLNYGTQSDEKLFLFPLILIKNDITETQHLLNDFVAFLFDSFGKPKQIKIIFDYEPDKYYTAECSSQISPVRLMYATRFNLEFIAYDSRKYAELNAYDPVEDVLYDQVEPNDYYDNPAVFNWIYEKHYSGINNYSHLVTDFSVTIEGTVNNPAITNLNSNQRLTLPSISNGKLEINSKDYTVTKNGDETLLGSNGNFFDIQPGEVGLLFEGINPNAIVTYKWLHKFI